ncbi:hypothetical protein SAMN05660226_02587, partial [Parapedobacter luteus]
LRSVLLTFAHDRLLVTLHEYQYLSRTLAPPLTLRLFYLPQPRKAASVFASFSAAGTSRAGSGTYRLSTPRSVWDCKGKELFLFHQKKFYFFFTPRNARKPNAPKQPQNLTQTVQKTTANSKLLTVSPFAGCKSRTLIVNFQTMR